MRANGAAALAAAPRVGLWPIAPDRLAAEWETLAPCFEAAASATYGRFTAGDIRAAVDAGELLVFAIIDFASRRLLAIVCAQRIASPRRVIGEVCFTGAHPAAGPMPEGGWRSAFGELCQHLGALGCEQVEVTGRPGWGRALGLTPTGAQFVVNLTRRPSDGQ